MKKSLLFLLCVLSAWQLGAQSPNAFRYQAVVKDNNGDLLSTASVKFRFEIFKSALEADGGIKVYSENQQVTTSSTGLVNLSIGTGTPETGTFSTIDWSSNSYYVKVNIDRGSGYSIIGEQQLVNAPYTLFADVAGNVINKTSDGTMWGMTVDNSGQLSTVPFPVGYTKMVWNDEFTGTGLPDSSKWNYEQGYVRKDEPQYYAVKRLENTYQKDGILHIVSKNDSSIIDGEMRPISSASIHTNGKATWLYGYIEVKAKLPYQEGIGTWPAIWMVGAENFYGIWPASGEIDIMEEYGVKNGYKSYRYVNFSLHSFSANGANCRTSSSYCSTVDLEFHTYGLQWTPEALIWYVDGIQKWRQNNKEHLWSSWPFNKSFYLILNLAMLGGQIDYKEFKVKPMDYQIEYVRIFQ